MDELEFVSWFAVGLLAAVVVLVSFLYWLESERTNEQIKQNEDYQKFLETGDDYHFLRKEDKE